MDKTRECATWLWLHNTEFRRWRIAVIEGAIRHWWTEWQKHPAFEDHPYNDEPHNPIIQLAVEHEPGVGGRTRSFIIGSLLGATAPKQIALARKMGHAFTLEAISPDHPVDPWFVSVLSYSYAGRGRGYWARRSLKELLPKRLHRLITKVRRLNRMAKFLPVREPGMPDWFREKITLFARPISTKCVVPPLCGSLSRAARDHTHLSGFGAHRRHKAFPVMP